MCVEVNMKLNVTPTCTLFLEMAFLLTTSQKVEKPLVAVRDTNDPQLSFFEAQRIADQAHS
jgi:hypothetical protein